MHTQRSIVSSKPNFRANAQARRQMIGAVATTRYDNELVHVYALEAAGFSIRFLDEAIAAALGDDMLIRGGEECQPLEQVLATEAGYTTLLEPDGFAETHGKGCAYTLAQLTIQAWLERFGLKPILEMIQAIVGGETPTTDCDHTPTGTASHHQLRPARTLDATMRGAKPEVLRSMQTACSCV